VVRHRLASPSRRGERRAQLRPAPDGVEDGHRLGQDRCHGDAHRLADAEPAHSPRDARFTNRFLVVTQGITIRDRLRVLLPSDEAHHCYQDKPLPPSLRRCTRTARGVARSDRSVPQACWASSGRHGDGCTHAPPLNRASLDLALARSDFGTRRVDGLSQWVGDHPVILFDDAAPPDRVRLTLAHELGHLVLHAAAMSVDDVEAEANAFAAEFLMPAEVVRPSLRNLKIGRLIDLKCEYGVSMQAS